MNALMDVTAQFRNFNHSSPHLRTTVPREHSRAQTPTYFVALCNLPLRQVKRLISSRATTIVTHM